MSCYAPILIFPLYQQELLDQEHQGRCHGMSRNVAIHGAMTYQLLD